jgi:RecT family
MEDKLKIIDGEFETENGTSTALAVTAQPGNFSLEHWQAMKGVAADMIKSGAIPRGISNPAQLQMIIQAGYEVGMPPVQAMGSFAIINGRISMWGAAVIARVNQAGHDLEWGHCDKMGAEVTILRNGKGKPETFTIEEAREAGLTTKDIWKKYPKDMLRWKALGRSVRLTCPEVLNGVYIAEEARDMEPEKPSAEITEIKFEGAIETEITELLKNEPEGKRAALRAKYQDKPEELIAYLKGGEKPKAKGLAFDELTEGAEAESANSEVAPEPKSADALLIKEISEGLDMISFITPDVKADFLRLYKADLVALRPYINICLDKLANHKTDFPDPPPYPKPAQKIMDAVEAKGRGKTEPAKKIVAAGALL